MAPDNLDLHHPDNDKYTSENIPHENDDVGVDDFALESAIGDAFQQFGFMADKKHKDDETTIHGESVDGSQSAEINEESHSADEMDVDLEAAVGNVFQSLENQLRSEFGEYKEDKADKDEGYHQEFKEEYNEGAPQTLEVALTDDAHNPKSVQNEQADHVELPTDHANVHQDHENGQKHHGDYQPDEQGPTDEYSTYPLQAEKSDEEQVELDLEAAIGDAFKSITDQKDLQQESAEPHHESEPALYSATHSPEDDKLEDAIGEAFKSLAEYSQPQDENYDQSVHHELPNSNQPSEELHAVEDSHIEDVLHGHQDADTNHDHDLTAAITASFNEIMGNKPAERRHSDTGFDLAGIVQNVVQQMASSQDVDQKKEKKEIPHLDENVLAHFQMEANKDEDRYEVATLKDVIATAAKNVMLKAVTDDVDADRPEQDLEKLQMNEILQNAFNMAMLNPQELLTSLNDDENKESSSRTQNLSTAAAIAALSMKEVLEKTDTLQTEKTSTEMSSSGPAKSLSIAETLALHRSSMNVPRRDYSSILSLEESMRTDQQRNPAMNPQLSNILSSLSHHIQSGNQSQNLMLVIRQMTNALMLNKTSSSVSTAAQDLLQAAKSHPDEKKFFLENLLATKSFLSSETASDLKKRAMTLIDNVMGLFNEKDSIVSYSEGAQIDKTEELSDFYQSTFSTLSSFNNSRVRNILAGIKPELDSSEYKEKIRIDNRERKKKWREENAERNKDNDLRSRVIKRANNMFGEESTPEKRAWVEEEFNKRREKRLAKQKKEEMEKPLSMRSSEAAETKPLVSAYTEDPKLVKRVTDIFSLVAETGLDDDPQTILEATSAATAVAASTYAKSIGLADGKPVQSAVTQILTNVLDSTVRSGTFMRIPFLSKVYNTSRPSDTTPSETSDLMSRFSSLTAAGNVGEGKSALEILQNSRKRLGLEFLTSDFKRTRAEQNSGLFLEKEKSSVSRIESEIDQLRTSINSTTSSHLWNATSALKMPQYKKPATSTPIVKPEKPTPSISKPSPFISNKIGLAGSTIPSPSVGLRKPGSFQRPAYSKPPSKGKSLGFPTLYSPSFKLK